MNKITLPRYLRAQVIAARAAIRGPGGITQAAAVLGHVLDFYHPAVERAFAEANSEFYHDAAQAMDAARNTSAYRVVLTLRLQTIEKSKSTALNEASFFEKFLGAALAGQVNLYGDAPAA